MSPRSALVAMLVGWSIGCTGSAPEAVVLHNGKVYTAVRGQEWAQAVLVVGDRIVAVGRNDSVLAVAPRGAKRIDVGQRLVIPGLNDAHAHIAPSLPAREIVTSSDPTADPSAPQVLDSLESMSRRTAPGTRLRITVGEQALADSRVRRGMLDSVTGDRPVEVRAWTGHGIVLNSAALAAAGISDSTPDPIGGRFERDSTGRLTGLLEEYAGYNAAAALAGRTDSAVAAAFRDRAAVAVRMGVTTLQNMSTGVDAAVLARVVPTLDLPVRVRLIAFPITTATTIERDPLAAVAATARISVSGVKWVLDGTPVERLALSRAPYQDRPDWRGRPNFSYDTLRVLLSEAARSNQQPHVHAVGDSAIAMVLAALTAAGPDSLWRRLRPRIEHGDGLAPDQFQRAKDLGVVFVQNPTHFALGPVGPTRYGPARMAVFQPARTTMAKGLPFAFGSDGPVNPFVDLLLATIHPDNQAEALTMERAVWAYTAGSAFAEHAEGQKGSLSPWLLADLAVLSQDIFSVPPNAIPGTTSIMTMVAGRVVRDSLGWLER